MDCYLCGSGKNKIIHVGTRDVPEINVLKCDYCGLVFLSSFDHIYDCFYEEGKMLSKNVDFFQSRAETWADDKRRFNYLRGHIKNKRVLDFGCGNGGFLKLAAKTASAAHGVEVDMGMLSALKTEPGFIGEVYSSIEGVSERYDIITAFHVLEHLKNPSEMLSRLLERLDDNGQLIIEVPSCNDALLSLYKSVSFSDFTYWGCHLYLFNESTLSKVIKKAGANIKIDYIKQVQRYPLSNHLYWLSTGKAGGHEKWSFLDEPMLSSCYEKALASIGGCDTIIASVSKL